MKHHKKRKPDYNLSLLGGSFIELHYFHCNYFCCPLKDVAIGGWQLKHSAGEEDETTYKFHRSVHIKPGAYVTVSLADLLCERL